MYEADVGIAVTKSDRFDVQRIVAAVQRAVGTPNGMLALHEPVFAGNEIAYLEECIKSTFVSSVGKFVDRFESMLEEVTGAKRAIAVVNGTAALHACFRLAGVEAGRRGDVAGADVHRDHQCDRLLRREPAFRRQLVQDARDGCAGARRPPRRDRATRP